MSHPLPLPASVLLMSAKKVNEEVLNFHDKEKSTDEQAVGCVPSSRSRHCGFGRVGCVAKGSSWAFSPCMDAGLPPTEVCSGPSSLAVCKAAKPG